MRNEDLEPTIYVVSNLIQDGNQNCTVGARFDICRTQQEIKLVEQFNVVLFIFLFNKQLLISKQKKLKYLIVN